MTHFYKTWDTNAHYNFGMRKFNIIHCQLRNEASNLKAHLFNDLLSDNTNCPNCSGSLEDNNHFLLICPKFNNFRFILLDWSFSLFQIFLLKSILFYFIFIKFLLNIACDISLINYLRKIKFKQLYYFIFY